MTPRPLRILGAWGAAAALGCSSETILTTSNHLDRPSDVAFGCVVRPAAPDGGTLGPPVAAPLSRCASQGGDAGPTGDFSAHTAGFILEGPRGDVQVATLAPGTPAIHDSDPFTPGTSGIPVGSLPVEIATTPEGCFAVTANAGSCDLGVLDVLEAFQDRAGAAYRLGLAIADKPLAASPASIAMPPALPRDPLPTCEATATGVTYVALPACHAVASVDLGTGQVLASVRFPAGGPPTPGGPELACPMECPEVAGAIDGPFTPGGEPAVLAMDREGDRLFVGQWNSSTLTIVGLDGAGGFTTVDTVPLEGAEGILRLAITPDIEMMNPGRGGPTRRFVYAIGRDRAIHVVDVTRGGTPVECDTQVDPRFAHDVTDLQLLSCFPVGDPRTPPRRPRARGPGIRLPHGAVPNDVAFLVNPNPPTTQPGQPPPDPANVLYGVFAVVTTLGPFPSAQPRGAVYYVNVDDDHYEDIENPGTPGRVDMVRALPHQIRDNVVEAGRSGLSDCAEDQALVSNPLLGVTRTVGEPTRPTGLLYNLNAEATEGFTPGGFLEAPIVPMIRRGLCKTATRTIAVLQTSSMADPALRELIFPDLSALETNETWTVAWEGPLTNDPKLQARDGGLLSLVGSTIELLDGAGPFCDAGVEVGDVVRLLGCVSDLDCGYGEVCYVHPDTPPDLNGMCLPGHRVDELGGVCRDVLVARRRYTVVDVGQGRLTMVTRPVLLPQSPLEGCTSTQQCMDLHTALNPGVAATFECRPEPGRGGPDRCVRTCQAQDQCGVGSVCEAGVCVYGALPPPACVGSPQRYVLGAGEAFTVIGNRTGYVHGWIADGMGGCTLDPAAHPLLVSRFGLDAPVCGDDDTLTTFGPNPCRVDFEDEPVFVRGTGADSLSVRSTHGMRFRNFAFRLDFADIRVPLGGHEGLTWSPIPDGYQFSFVVGGGYFPKGPLIDASFPTRIRPAPDGTLWVVDTADWTQNVIDPPRGQLIQITRSATGGGASVR